MLFLSVTLLNEAKVKGKKSKVKTTKRSRRAGNEFEKIKKMAPETFSGNFLRAGYSLTGEGQIQRKTKNPVFINSLV